MPKQRKKRATWSDAIQNEIPLTAKQYEATKHLEHGETALTWACRCRNIGIDDLIEKNESLVLRKNQKGETPISILLEQGAVIILDKLLQYLFECKKEIATQLLLSLSIPQMAHIIDTKVIDTKVTMFFLSHRNSMLCPIFLTHCRKYSIFSDINFSLCNVALLQGQEYDDAVIFFAGDEFDFKILCLILSFGRLDLAQKLPWKMSSLRSPQFDYLKGTTNHSNREWSVYSQEDKSPCIWGSPDCKCMNNFNFFWLNHDSVAFACLAIECGHKEIFHAIVDNHHFNVYSKTKGCWEVPSGFTALHSAIEHGQVEFAKILTKRYMVCRYKAANDIIRWALQKKQCRLLCALFEDSPFKMNDIVFSIDCTLSIDYNSEALPILLHEFETQFPDAPNRKILFSTWFSYAFWYGSKQDIALLLKYCGTHDYTDFFLFHVVVNNNRMDVMDCLMDVYPDANENILEKKYDSNCFELAIDRGHHHMLDFLCSHFREQRPLPEFSEALKKFFQFKPTIVTTLLKQGIQLPFSIFDARSMFEQYSFLTFANQLIKDLLPFSLWMADLVMSFLENDTISPDQFWVQQDNE